MHGFEGTYLGDASKLKDTDCLECKVCHYVYDPEKETLIRTSSLLHHFPNFLTIGAALSADAKKNCSW